MTLIVYFASWILAVSMILLSVAALLYAMDVAFAKVLGMLKIQSLFFIFII